MNFKAVTQTGQDGKKLDGREHIHGFHLGKEKGEWIESLLSFIPRNTEREYKMNKMLLTHVR